LVMLLFLLLWSVPALMVLFLLLWSVPAPVEAQSHVVSSSLPDDEPVHLAYTSLG
jgi:uncharacterized membrane protein